VSPFDNEHFTDLEGNPPEDRPEPLPCPFCGSPAAQLVIERWSEEDDPDASYHVECLKGVEWGIGRHSARGGAGMERTERIAVSKCGKPRVADQILTPPDVLDDRSDALQRDGSGS
jgi:hypothetical protein